MKKRELIKKLRKVGWHFLKEGKRHEIWTNGKEQEPIPRHAEIKEVLALKIIKRASRYAGTKEN